MLVFIAFSNIHGTFVPIKGLIYIIKMYYYSLNLKNAYLFHSLSSSVRVFWAKSYLYQPQWLLAFCGTQPCLFAHDF